MGGSAGDDALSGAGQRQNYESDENLVKRQGLWAYVDPSLTHGGIPIQRISLRGDETVVDVGCGNGIWLSGLQGQVRTAVGVDLSAGMLAATRAKAEGVGLIQADAAELPLVSGSADVVLALHMLYHVADQQRAIQELYRIIRPGGVALVSTNSTKPTAIEVLGRVSVAAVLGRPEGPILPELSFNAGNGLQLLGAVFEEVEPAWHVAGHRITRAGVLVDFLASVRGPMEMFLGVDLDWDAVASEVTGRAAAVIDADGAFISQSEAVSYLCRKPL